MYELHAILNKVHKVQAKNKVQKVRTSQLCSEIRSVGAQRVLDVEIRKLEFSSCAVNLALRFYVPGPIRRRICRSFPRCSF